MMCKCLKFPDDYHWPHFIKGKNNECFRADFVVGELVDKLKDGRRYKWQLIDDAREVAHEADLGVFRRFNYEEYTEESKSEAKAFAKEYERGK